MFVRRSKPRGIVVVVERQEQLDILLSRGYRLAKVRNEELIIFVISDTDAPPDWLSLPSKFDRDRVRVHPILPERAGRRIARYVSDHPPVLVAFCADRVAAVTESGWNPELTDAVHRIKCPVAILINPWEWKIEDRVLRTMVPYWDDEHSRYAIRTSLAINPESSLTVVAVADVPMDEEGLLAFEQDIKEQLGPLADDPRVSTKVLHGDVAEALLHEEARQHDSILLGVSRGRAIQRALFGETSAVAMRDAARKLIEQKHKPVVLIREYQGWLGSTLARVFATGERLFPSLERSERIEVYRQIRRAARPKMDFFLMISLSAAIAALGLVLDSPAVIIGAMLIAPLMSAIVAMGLAIVQGDMTFLLRSLRATLQGAAIVIFVGFLIGLFYLDRIGTQEMLSRTGPTLLDLLVATVSGVAAAYALCRKNVSASLPGVAIAVALVPPLATVGLFLGIRDLPLAYGAFLLFLTNLAGITFASGVVFTLLGFRPPTLEEKNLRRIRLFQRSFLAAGLLLLAVFSHLTVLSVEEIEEFNIEYSVESVLKEHFTEGSGASLVRWEMFEDESNVPEVFVHLSSPTDIDRSRMATLAEQLASELGTPVRLTVTQIPAFTVNSSTVKEAVAESRP